MAVTDTNHWVWLISTVSVPTGTPVDTWQSHEIVDKLHMLVSWRDGNIIIPVCRTGVLRDIVEATMDMYPMVECLLRESHDNRSAVKSGRAYVQKDSQDSVVDMITAAVNKSKQNLMTPVDSSVVYPIHVKHDINYPQQLMNFNRYMREACPDNKFAQHLHRYNEVAWMTLADIKQQFPQQAIILEKVFKAYQYQAS